MTETVVDLTPIDLGDEVVYKGALWRLDDEALVGLEGQPDVVFNTLDREEVRAVLDSLRPATRRHR